MKRRTNKFLLTSTYEICSGIVFLFLTLIPFMYMVTRLQKADDIFASALATILAYALRDGPVPSGIEFTAIEIGVAIGMALLVVLFRVTALMMNYDYSPNKDRLFEMIDDIPRKKDREAFCSSLLHVVDGQKL